MQKENQLNTNQELTKISKEGWIRLKNLKESFLQEFDKILNIEIDLHYSKHVPVEDMISIIAETSRRSGIDCIVALNHFRFTKKEIKEYFKIHNHSISEILP